MQPAYGERARQRQAGAFPTSAAGRNFIVNGGIETGEVNSAFA
jgi:hypothetical protein